MDDGCWMMLMVDGWKRQRGIFLMLHCSPVGDGSGWPFSGTGGLETWPGGFCGGALTLTTRGQGTGHTSGRCNHRSSTWNGKHGHLFSVITLSSCFNTSLL